MAYQNAVYVKFYKSFDVDKKLYMLEFCTSPREKMFTNTTECFEE